MSNARSTGAVALEESQSKNRRGGEIDRVTKSVHRMETRSSTADVATALQRLFGRELTALMAGVDNTRTVAQWARGESLPHSSNERRLRSAYRVASLLLEGGESERTVRSWFMGMNPLLDDLSPAEVIKEKPTEVMEAAKDFLVDA
jgi:hypothetical protein